jgi:hypothetical protein
VEGKWYKINNQSLSYSTDGVTWKPSPDGRWVGSDGNTYRLEENCALNVMKGASLGKVDFLKEKEIYKRKINDRIQTLETRLEKLRSDLKNNPSYGSSIEKIEKTRGQLKLKLNELGDKAEVNWAQFKKDLDSFLNKESEQ